MGARRIVYILLTGFKGGDIKMLSTSFLARYLLTQGFLAGGPSCDEDEDDTNPWIGVQVEGRWRGSSRGGDRDIEVPAVKKYLKKYQINNIYTQGRPISIITCAMYVLCTVYHIFNSNDSISYQWKPQHVMGLDWVATSPSCIMLGELLEAAFELASTHKVQHQDLVQRPLPQNVCYRSLPCFLAATELACQNSNPHELSAPCWLCWLCFQMGFR